MNFESYRQNVIAEVQQIRNVMAEGLRKAFVSWMNSALPDEDAGDIEPLYLNAKFKQKNVGVDGYAYLTLEHTLILVIADWNEFDEKNALTRSEAESLLKKLRSFFEFAKKGTIQDNKGGILEWSSSEYGLAELIRSEQIDRVRLLLYTDRKLSDRFKRLNNSPIGDVAVEEDVWTLERLYEHICSRKEHEPIVLDFHDNPIALTQAAVGQGFHSYLGVISAAKLSDFYRSYGGRLLEGNVRSFLSLKTSVNKDIRNTILNDPEHFFVYNNGIAVTVQDMELDQHGRLVQATDFQIINGGQTTASLARAVYTDKADVSKIQVAVKLTHVDKTLDPVEARQLIRNISRFSNNQNKVSGTDFSSNHEFHIMMEKASSRIPAPPAPGLIHRTYWYYERNRGSYQQEQMFMNKGERARFDTKYKDHVIKKENFARVRLAWDCRPNDVAYGNVKLFAMFMSDIDSKWETLRNNGEFGDDYFRESISLWIMHQNLREEVQHATWYDKGYLANIVVYAMSSFSWKFKLEYPDCEFDFSKIWNHQRVPDELLELLLVIARVVKTSLTDPRRLKENVTEWAKSPECWRRVQKTFIEGNFKLPDFVREWCKSKSQIAQQKNQAKQKATVDRNVLSLKSALEYKYWDDAVKYAKKINVLTPLQLKAISKCIDISLTIPNERDIGSALEALDILRSEGFKY